MAADRQAILLSKQFLHPQEAKASKNQGTHLQQSPKPRGVEEIIQETHSIHISAVEQIQLLQHKPQDLGEA